MSKKIHAFVNGLREIEVTGSVYNPWRDYDPDYDVSADAPKMRRENLIRFLEERKEKARFLLVGEAPSYQGAKFSGIAMMSERILCGRRVDTFPREGYHVRTSNPNGPNLSETVQRFGFNEPTATIVWSAVLENGIDPRSVVTWNIFPFHPHHNENPDDALSNRTPTDAEIGPYRILADEFMALFPGATVLAVGQKAGNHLNLEKNRILRHPANGGAKRFRYEFLKLCRG